MEHATGMQISSFVVYQSQNTFRKVNKPDRNTTLPFEFSLCSQAELTEALLQLFDNAAFLLFSHPFDVEDDIKIEVTIYVVDYIALPYINLVRAKKMIPSSKSALSRFAIAASTTSPGGPHHCLSLPILRCATVCQFFSVHTIC